MDTRSRLSRALRTPILFCRHANRLYHRRFGRRECNEDGVDPFEADWDNLFILDACRYDMFRAPGGAAGPAGTRRVPASTTVEFLRANVDGRDLSDTVYVTANPQLSQHRESIDAQFAAVVDVWRADGWSNEHGTVLPETVTEHAPGPPRSTRTSASSSTTCNPTTRSLGPTLTSTAGTSPTRRRPRKTSGYSSYRDKPTWIGTKFRNSDGNLDRALPHVEDAMRELGGKTIVTADHGNMVGERVPDPVSGVGHPRGVYTPELVDVPWLVYERGPPDDQRGDSRRSRRIARRRRCRRTVARSRIRRMTTTRETE